MKHLLLAGNPNVGKSVIFGLLTGRYAVVSNYPGTTVEVSRGNARIEGQDFLVVDTPGANSLVFPTSDDEIVSRNIVARNAPTPVIQVADAKNLPRALILTLELAEMGCPTVLCINMSDEAAVWGLRLRHKKLSELLGIPVVATVATQRIGLSALRNAVTAASVPRILPEYRREIEEHMARVSSECGVSRGIAATALSRPDVPLNLPGTAPLAGCVSETAEEQPRSTGYQMLLTRTRKAQEISVEVIEHIPSGSAGSGISGTLTVALSVLAAGAGGFAGGAAGGFLLRVLSGLSWWGTSWLLGIAAALVFAHRLWKARKTHGGTLEATGSLAMSPVWGLLMLAGVLYATYLLVGVAVAGNLVDFLTGTVFGEYEDGRWGGWINGPLSRMMKSIAGESIAYRMLFDIDGGLVSKGLTYSFAIVGPIVAAFFFLFSLLEDSGYLPRLSVMSDRFFKRMGLSGRAALPMVLGLGCATMATLATRILSTRKERILAILLLALAIPCSAQLGIIAGVLSKLTGAAVIAFAFIIIAVLLFVGSIGAKVLKGPSAGFLLEVPPFRPPMMRNVGLKTWYRSLWFLREAVPVFLLGSFVLWVMKETVLLGLFEEAMSPVVNGVLGLPDETARGFLLGFLRRDYAAVEIFNLFERGLVDPNQVFIALVTITLFVPCVANFFVMIKEAGMRKALYMVAFIIPFAFAVGGLVRLVLALTGIDLESG